ncbi:MAG: amidohydrolase family protein [Betaproteobacteria bacterium]|nr:amidohydrolase family protein [Betaproteobacteria bacterium]
MSLEIMFPIAWGGVWDYPYKEAHPLIRDLRDRLGAEKLLWGSDMPNLERFCTYRQSLHYVQRYCDFLSPSDMDRILGGNAARLYRIGATSH